MRPSRRNRETGNPQASPCPTAGCARHGSYTEFNDCAKASALCASEVHMAGLDQGVL